MNEIQKTTKRIIILGASLDTGNLGVSALLASTIKGILSACPDARFSLFESRKVSTDRLNLANGKVVRLGCVGIRRNKTFWRQSHIFHLLLIAIIARLIVVKSWRQKWLRSNQYICQIMDAQFVADITGGDSFSDIYGFRRLAIGTLFKMLPILLGTKFVLLPQTYGPFKLRLSRCLARLTIQRANAIYSRDQEGLIAVKQLLDHRKAKAIPQFCPDVAFLLDVIRPEVGQTAIIEKLKADGKQLIGLNISGLLYNGGYTQNNMFGLKSDYKTVVSQMIQRLFAQPNVAILLVPHVFPDSRLAVESDLAACKMVYEQLCIDYPDRLYCLDGTYDQSQIKYMIGQCDFFIGSRMHACIAALSQGIPAVGFAYSKKFHGVFESAGVADCVVDMRQQDGSKILKRIDELYHSKEDIRQRLVQTIPTVKQKVLAIFDGF